MYKKVPAILLIYTGGTIGMVQDHTSGTLIPMDFENILNQVPEVKRLECCLTSITLSPIIDSSNITIQDWKKLALLIEESYNDFDGFVILHGTDTMSFTASALSFMFNNLTKPVVLTGSQLPIGTLRTDGKENLITAIEIASTYKHGRAVVPEVCVYFENKLYRGNRTTKHYSDFFNAFKSHNYPPLAEVGIHIKYNFPYINYVKTKEPFFLQTEFDNSIALIKIFPGMRHFVESVLETPNLRAVILESYGTGNAPKHTWFVEALKKALKKGILIINVSQCPGGRVETGRYETGLDQLEGGIINGHDITTEAALAKMMYLMAQYTDSSRIIEKFNSSLRGEITV